MKLKQFTHTHKDQFLRFNSLLSSIPVTLILSQAQLAALCFNILSTLTSKLKSLASITVQHIQSQCSTHASETSNKLTNSHSQQFKNSHMYSLSVTPSKLQQALQKNQREMYIKNIKAMQVEWSKKLKLAEEDAFTKLRNQIEKRQKKLKTVQSRLAKLEEQKKQQIQTWQSRFIQMKSEFQVSSLKLKQSHQKQKNTLQQAASLALQNQQKQLQQLILLKDNHLNLSSITLTKQLQEKFEERMRRMQLSHVQMINNIQTINNQRLQQQQQSFSVTMKNNQAEKASQSLQLKRIRLQLQTRKNQFYEKNYLNLKQKDSLKSLLQSYQKTALDSKLQINRLNQLVQSVTVQHQVQLQKIHTHCQLRVKLNQDMLNQKYRLQIDKQKAFIQAVQKQLSQIKAQEKKQKQIIAEQMSEVNKISIEYCSKLKSENNTTAKLGKQIESHIRQNKILKENIKDLKLQLQNKQKLYNKIFNPSNEEEKADNKNDRQNKQKEKEKMPTRKGAQSVYLDVQPRQRKSLGPIRVQNNPMMAAIAILRQNNMNTKALMSIH